MPNRYLSLREFAARVGLEYGTLQSYRQKKLLPEPDALTGRVQGWLPETVDHWQANRPGRGARTDLRK